MLFRRSNTSSIIDSKSESKIYKKFRKSVKYVSLVLVIAILFTAIDAGTLLKASGFFDKSTVETIKERDPRSGNILYEIKEQRSKYEKVFRKDDGTYEVVTYKDPVHYEKDGHWEEIDNTLSDDETGSYKSNKSNKFKVDLPKVLKEDKKIKLKNGETKISFSILGINDSNLESIQLDGIESDVYIKKNNNSKVLYQDVFDNVDLEYIIQGQSLKENIILNQYKENFEIVFNIDAKGLDVIETEDGIIEFYNDNELVYIIDQFFMNDNNLEYSNDIETTLEKVKKDNYLLTVKPNNEWLLNAEYPVIIDPTYTIDYSSIEDAYTRFDTWNPTANYGNDAYVRIGYDNVVENKTGYIKFDLPSYLDGKLLTYADLNLYATSTSGCPSDGCVVNAHRISSNWSENTINYSDKPSFDSTLIDYQPVQSGKTVTFDITDAAKYWEVNGGYYGIRLSAKQSNNFANFASSENSTSSIRPYFQIGFVDNTGLENYWTYHSNSLGEAGTGYINDATGNLTWVLPLYSNPTLRTPFTLSLIHNSNTTDNIGYGNGWRTNFNERILIDYNEDVPGYYSNSYYNLIDGDGTKKYFITGAVYPEYFGLANSCGIAEDGSYDYGVFGFNYGDYEHEIHDKDGTIKKFDVSGRLVKVVDIDGNDIDIVYEGTSERINYIEDTLGNRIDFHYTSGVIDKITLPDGNYYDLSISNYQTNIYLINSLHEKDFETTFTYDTSSRITVVDNSYGNELYYNYTSSKVSKVEEKESGALVTEQYYFNGSTGTTIQYYPKQSSENGMKVEVSLFGDSYSSDYGATLLSSVVIDGVTYSLDFVNEDEVKTITLNNVNGSVSVDGFMNVQIDYDEPMDITITDRTLDFINETVTSLGYMDINYNFKRTKFTDFKENESFYSFDTFGRTINVLDSNGNAQFYKYADIFDKNSAYYKNYRLNNHLEEVSLPQKNIVNPIDNHSFEFGLNDWSTVIDRNVGTVKAQDKCGLFGTEAVYGVTNTSCSVLERNGIGTLGVDRLELRQTVVLDAGTYIVSGYINSDYGAVGGVGAYIDVEGASSKETISEVQNSGKWIKYKLGFEVANNDTNITIVLKNEVGTGKAYFDQIQIDEGFIDQRFNYLENSSFENSLSGWTYSGAYIVNNSKTESYKSYSNVLSDKSILLSSGTRSYIKQDLEGIVTDTKEVIFGGWFKGDIPHNSNEEVEIILTYRAPSGDEIALIYNIDKNINEWQYFMFSFNPYLYGDILSIEVSYEGNSMLSVDNMQLYIEDFGSKYTYNDDGNIEKVDKPGLNYDTKFNYSSSNKNYISSINDTNPLNENDIKTTTNFKYDESNRLKESLSPSNVKTSFEYDSYGNTDLVTIGDFENGSWFRTNTTYANLGNYVDEVKDEFGNIYDFNYNSNTGLLDNIIDPNGKTTSYNYDSFGRLLEVIKGNSNANYYYSKGKLSEIEVNGFRYKINYDDYERVKDIHVANVMLMQYNYELYKDTIETNKLVEQIYGNGDSIKFGYDSEDRISEVYLKVNGAPDYDKDPSYKYEYDTLGNLAEYVDKENGKEYHYNYDLRGRLKCITDELGNTVSYGYDKNTGNVSDFNYNVNGKSREINYVYDDNLGLYDKTTYTSNGKTVTKDYIYEDTTKNSLGRLNYISLYTGNITILTSYRYFDDSEVDNGNASTRIKSIGQLSRFQSFTYDKKGFITSINDNKTGLTKYYYDDLGQLVREDNPVSNKTYVYGYDKNGNIEFKEEYTYTTNETIETSSLDRVNYEYNETGWRDQLNTADGRYSYDEIGNPTMGSDKNGGWYTYSWEGRQLVFMSYPVAVTYKYNDQGIRVQKNHAGEITDYYVVGNKVIYEKTGNDVIYYTYDVDGTLIGFNYRDTDYFYTRNIFGDIITIMDSYSNILVEYEYDAWGNIVNDYKASDKSGINLGEKNPYRYRGYRYDDESGFYYLNSRYYNPRVGRFINADGLLGKPGDILSHNMYAYCQNNPVMKVDPNGDFAWWIAGAVVGGIAGAAVSYYTTGEVDWKYVAAGALIGAGAGALAQYAYTAGAVGETITLAGTTKGLAEEIAVEYTHNASSDTFVLGKWEGVDIPTSYQNIAEDLGFTYYQMPSDVWEHYSDKYGEEFMWEINKAFLNNQMSANKMPYFTHFDITGWFKEEINYIWDYLQELADSIH